MAAPTAPALASITAEGLKKAGHSTSDSDWASLLSRAQNEWIEEAKNDIWMVPDVKLKSLFFKRALTLTNGVAIYANPSDYHTDMTMNLLVGLTYGTCDAAGTTTSVIVKTSSGTLTDDFVRGKKIIITSGTGLNSWSICTSYTSGTSTIACSPAMETAGAEDDAFLIVDEEYPIEESPIWELSKEPIPSLNSLPLKFYPIGDEDNGEFVLFPVPYNSNSIPMVVFQRYHMNLMKVDLSSTRLATFYQKARNLLTQKVVVECMRNDNDPNLNNEEGKYYQLLKRFVTSDTYGSNMSNMQSTIDD